MNYSLGLHLGKCSPTELKSTPSSEPLLFTKWFKVQFNKYEGKIKNDEWVSCQSSPPTVRLKCFCGSVVFVARDDD